MKTKGSTLNLNSVVYISCMNHREFGSGRSNIEILPVCLLRSFRAACWAELLVAKIRSSIRYSCYYCYYCWVHIGFYLHAFAVSNLKKKIMIAWKEERKREKETQTHLWLTKQKYEKWNQMWPAAHLWVFIHLKIE